jgi:putative CocE/NonD family hydrolase
MRAGFTPFALVLCVGFAAHAAPLVSSPIVTADDWGRALREHYTKREVAIPMRDGVRLHTDVWVPKAPAWTPSASATHSWPILLVRTPYSVQPYGVENAPDPQSPRVRARFAPSAELLQSGYIFVHQDVRGRLMSEGTFVDVRPVEPAEKKKRDRTVIDESTDAWDTIDWLVTNVPENNGRVGIWGISYPGFYAAQAGIDAHPALKAISPQAPVTEWFLGDDFHHNGALCLADAFSFFQGFGRPRPQPTKKMEWDFDYNRADSYDFFLHLGPIKNVNERHFKGRIAFWNDLMSHGTRDSWWQARDPRPHYRDIRPAALVVGGLFDAEDLWGTVATYRAMETQSPGGNVTLVLGPWTHGGWSRSDGDSIADLSFGVKTAVAYRQGIEFSFFESHLKGDGTLKMPEAIVFETGTHEWRSYDAWPPSQAKPLTLFLDAHGALSMKKPTTQSARDSFVADPDRPVPTVGYSSDKFDHDYVVADQRFAARRPDVLVYDSGVLAHDVTVAGPVEVDLWWQTTGTDADVVVKLIDVLPEDTADPSPAVAGLRRGGMQRLVRGEVMRGRFREGFDKPLAFAPHTPARIRFALPDVNHTFRTGHRLMVQIQASWFPLIDRNPQSFVDIANASESDFQRATHTVHRSQALPSSITLPVVRGSLAP